MWNPLQNSKGGEGKNTMKEIMEECICMNVPETKKLSDYFLLQKLVKRKSGKERGIEYNEEFGERFLRK